MSPTMQLLNIPVKNWFYRILLVSSLSLLNGVVFAQDSIKSLLDLNNSKLIKKVNSLLDTNQKKINQFLFKKIDKAKSTLDSAVKKFIPLEEDRPLPYEILLNKKYTLPRRAYQNTVSKFNYIFHGEQELSAIIQGARNSVQEDYTLLIPFYDYDLTNTSKNAIDSIIYRCNANIVLHDLRSNWVDDAYLLLAKAYLFHKNFDTAGSLLQYINYAFDEKIDGMEIPIGSNLRNTNGQFSIATKENHRFFENKNIRNESMLWQARNYFESKGLNEGLSLLQLLKSDAYFPKRLYPFLNEQLAYGYYLSDMYDSAASYLINALPNANTKSSKTRWYYLIAQLWEKSGQLSNAHTWYKKANKKSINPLISVYAKINQTKIEFTQTKTPWQELAKSLQQMAKKEKYTAYTDILYFEMAKLAIINNDTNKANEWLIVAIKKNENGLSQKQKAFELLGSINFHSNQYAVATLAYDSLNGVLKSNPDFEKIALRKKWLPSIQINDKFIQQQDTLQFIYQLYKSTQSDYLKNWQAQEKVNDNKIRDLFINESKPVNSIDYGLASNNFSNNSLAANNFANNGFEQNSVNNNSFQQNANPTSDFYFENKKSVEQGKNQFIQKWGTRPNVDQWRRKTSGNMVHKITNPAEIMQSGYQQSTEKALPLLDSLNQENSKSPSIQLIANEEQLIKSKIELNNKAFENAQIFLLQLDDFEKALPLYNKIIQLNIDSIITEKCLLDMASQYIHEGKTKLADSIISLVQTKFPNGVFVSKKTVFENRNTRNQSVEELYQEAYFLTQIGNWNQLSTKTKNLDLTLQKTKWHAPYQFLKVKMFAQQGMDSTALLLLDSIIYLHPNEQIRELAKNIILELKKRKETELYLANLHTNLLSKESLVGNKTIDQTNILPTENNLAQPLLEMDTLHKASTGNALLFTKKESEPHYVALLTNNLKEIMVKEVVTALGYLHQDEFAKQNLDVTYLEFEKNIFVVWIGPFENLNSSNSYLNKTKSRFNNEILSFIQPKQYELFILGKSNILQIKNSDDLKIYRHYMNENIYKQ